MVRRASRTPQLAAAVLVLAAAVLAWPAGGDMPGRRLVLATGFMAWTFIAVRMSRRGGPFLCAWWSLLVAAIAFDGVAVGRFFDWQITAADCASVETGWAGWSGKDEGPPRVPWWLASYLLTHRESRLVWYLREPVVNAALWWTCVLTCTAIMAAFGKSPPPQQFAEACDGNGG